MQVGAGMAYAYGAYAKDTTRVTPGQGFPDENGAGIGPWIDAGVRIRFGAWYSAGVGARMTRARGTLYGRRVDVGGWQAYATLLGFSWPKRPERRR